MNQFDGPTFVKVVLYPALVMVPFVDGAAAETITPDKWFQSLAEPVRTTIVHRAITEISATGQNPVDPYALTLPEVVTESRWHLPWAEPVRIKPRLYEGLQQFLAFNPLPVVPYIDRYLYSFAEPVRFRAIPVAQQPVTFFQPHPIISISWWQAFAEPVRPRPKGISTTSQKFFEFQPTPIISIGWWTAFAEPLRFLKPRSGRGLAAGEQSWLFLHPFPVISIAWWQPFAEPRRFRPALTAATADHPSARFIRVVRLTPGNQPLYRRGGTAGTGSYWKGRS